VEEQNRREDSEVNRRSVNRRPSNPEGNDQKNNFDPHQHPGFSSIILIGITPFSPR